MRPPLRRVVIPLLIIAVAVIGFLATRGGEPSADAGSAPSSASMPSASRGADPRTTTAAASGAHVANPSGLAEVEASRLPQEARNTLALVAKGGPYPYDRDGVVYSNFERVLPSKASGYYHEYTVVTPGSSDRGARRIVVGQTGEKYYTDDHYASFRFIVEGQ